MAIAKLDAYLYIYISILCKTEGENIEFPWLFAKQKQNEIVSIERLLLYRRQRGNT